jgi:Cys-tRNA(Pro) deacylase
MPDIPAATDPRLEGAAYVVATHARPSSMAEAAEMRGVTIDQMIKTMVVRVGDGSYVFVLVPGDRVIDWPKLRDHLGERRLSMPDADEALEVTGYERGTITPFGSSTLWPVVADAAIPGHTVSIGGGAHGVSLTIEGDTVVRLLDAAVVDVTKFAR